MYSTIIMYSIAHVKVYSMFHFSHAYLELLHAKQIELSFLTYLTRLNVLFVYPEKYTPVQVQHPGYPDLCAPLCSIVHRLRDTYKTNFLIELS